jgi:FkbM family methyltransferase
MGRRFLIRLLAKICSPLFVQRTLEFNVSVAHALMGVGSTGTLMSFTEKTLLTNFKKRTIHKESLVLFDVGANIGQYGGIIRKVMNGRKYAVHAFEPAVETFKGLCDNFDACKEFKLNNFGLGKEEETLQLYSNSLTSGCASLTRPAYNKDFKFSQAVSIQTGDEYCYKYNIDYIDWLKIDVEGHELDVLMGLQTMFTNKCIGEVFFEFGFPAIESRTFLRDYLQFFTQYGYVLSRVTLGGSLVPLRAYKGSYEQFRGASSYHAQIV